MKKTYKLNELYQIRFLDKALFNYQKAELTSFNDSGFNMLMEIIEKENNIYSDQELEFINKLLESNIIIAYEQ